MMIKIHKAFFDEAVIIILDYFKWIFSFFSTSIIWKVPAINAASVGYVANLNFIKS